MGRRSTRRSPSRAAARATRSPERQARTSGLGVSNLALNPKVDATVYVYGPDGAQLTAYHVRRGRRRLRRQSRNLPSTGTYGIVVRPSAGATGGFGVDAVVGLRRNVGRRRPGAAGHPRSARPQRAPDLRRNARARRCACPGPASRSPGAAGKRDRVPQHAERLHAGHRAASRTGRPEATTFPRCRRPAITRCSSIPRQGQR